MLAKVQRHSLQLLRDQEVFDTVAKAIHFQWSDIDFERDVVVELSYYDLTHSSGPPYNNCSFEEPRHGFDEPMVSTRMQAPHCVQRGTSMPANIPADSTHVRGRTSDSDHSSSIQRQRSEELSPLPRQLQCMAGRNLPPVFVHPFPHEHWNAMPQDLQDFVTQQGKRVRQRKRRARQSARNLQQRQKEAGHPQCTQRDDCIGNADCQLVQRCMDAVGGDVYCATCFLQLCKQYPEFGKSWHMRCI